MGSRASLTNKATHIVALSTFTFQPLYGQNSLQPAHDAGLTQRAKSVVWFMETVRNSLWPRWYRERKRRGVPTACRVLGMIGTADHTTNHDDVHRSIQLGPRAVATYLDGCRTIIEANIVISTDGRAPRSYRRAIVVDIGAVAIVIMDVVVDERIGIS